MFHFSLRICRFLSQNSQSKSFWKDIKHKIMRLKQKRLFQSIFTIVLKHSLQHDQSM